MRSDKRFMSIRAFATEFGIGLGQAYRAAHKNEVPAVRLGKRLWIIRDLLEEKLKEASKMPINTTT
jgi:hypothetical protein